MTDKQAFIEDIFQNGMTASASVSTGGTTCPCTTFVDATYPQYSKEYHRLNASPPDCLGTMVQGASISSIAIKANFGSHTSLKNQSAVTVWEKAGKIKETDLIMIGTVKVSDLTFYDLKLLNRHKDKIVFNGYNYEIKEVESIFTDVEFCQIALLGKIS